MLIAILLGVLTLLLIYFYFQSKEKLKGLKIPGIDGWPLVGAIFTVKGGLFYYLHQQGKKFDDFFYIKMGMRKIVVINNYNLLFKCFKENSITFSGRWKNIAIRRITRNVGVLFTDKELWATQRSFLLRILKDFGIGRTRSEEIIDEQCRYMVNEIMSKENQVIQSHDLFSLYTMNIICKLSMKITFERHDKDFQVLLKEFRRTAQEDNYTNAIILMYPCLDKASILSKLILLITGRYYEHEIIHDFIIKIIDEHELKFTPDVEYDDIINIFLSEKHKLDSNNIKDHTFTKWQLIRNVFELMVAGFDTTSTTLSYSVLLLSKHQDVQDKVHKEIMEVLGPDKLVTMNDKKIMPYTQAVMDEIMRLSSIVPLALPHKVLEDCEINGYCIPKNTIIFPNIYSIHHDEKQWKHPDKFYPEHFLSFDENNQMTYAPRNDLIPFSIGKRQCLGEALARMEFFKLFVSVFQHFQVSLPTNVTDKEFDKNILGTTGTIKGPLNTNVIFHKRQ